ncbi:MAG: hypothetical protein NT069_02385 [Planctomycetota bacterium]|nr:hypothetical protein [Planctomycetota bacterium]
MKVEAMSRGQTTNRIKSIDELVSEWTQRTEFDLELASLRDLIRFLGNELYSQYEPFIQKPPFWERLAAWVNNVKTAKDQQALFRLVPWLLFVGKSELHSMYESAFRGPITRWLIDSACLDIKDPAIGSKLADEVRHTWFGSLAGMDLGSFMRINGIEEQSLRPDFRVLLELGDAEQFDKYVYAVKNNGDRCYRRIVAVDDFVGSGTQMTKAAKGVGHLEDTPVLICPMISADEGCKAGKQLRKQYSHLDFQEYYRISSSARLRPRTADGEIHKDLAAVSEIIESTWELLKRPENYDKPYGFGDMGILVLTYLNCPNNVPPILHRMADETASAGKWMPLFPRANRET